MNIFLQSMNDSAIADEILSYLDPQSFANLAATSKSLHNALFHNRRFTVTGFGPTASVSFAESTTTASTSATDSEGQGQMDTDMTSSPDEEEWEFEVTPDLIRRLSLLPDRTQGRTMSTLPTELHLQIFSYLDQIDSCCLGLAHPNLYVVFRAIHGIKMPLNTRRIGPNRLESAWELVGKQECKQCGIYRCELHQHIKTWMPEELEYCTMKQNFGLRAIEGAKENCFRGKPSKPKRCGRHPLRTTSVHQDDSSFNLPSPSATE